MKNIYIIFVILNCCLILSCKNDKKASQTPAPVVNNPEDLLDQAAHMLDHPPVNTLPKFLQEGLEKLKDIQVTPDGIDSQVMDFLKRGQMDYGETFKFINLRFKANSAEVMPNTTKEIENLGLIMLAFPKMLVKIEAYSDNNGDEKKNEQLTQKKADFIVEKLYGMGVNKERLSGKGFGEKYPVGDNKTIEGQMINNRIEMMILRLQ